MKSFTTWTNCASVSSNEKHELSSLYEKKTTRMGNADRNGRDYYTDQGIVVMKLNNVYLPFADLH